MEQHEIDKALHRVELKHFIRRHGVPLPYDPNTENLENLKDLIQKAIDAGESPLEVVATAERLEALK